MEGIRRHLSFANVAAGLALLFSMSGGAIAATGGFSSGGTLKACANEEGRLKLLKSGEHCKRGQKSVSWSQTGPAGAPGAKGAPGTPGTPGTTGGTGPQGTPGAAATSLWALVGENGQVFEGHGVVTVTGKDPYTVTFNRNVADCAITASLDTPPATSIYAQPDEGKAAVATTAGATLTPSNFTVVASC